MLIYCCAGLLSCAGSWGEGVADCCVAGDVIWKWGWEPPPNPSSLVSCVTCCGLIMYGLRELAASGWDMPACAPWWRTGADAECCRLGVTNWRGNGVLAAPDESCDNMADIGLTAFGGTRVPGVRKYKRTLKNERAILSSVVRASKKQFINKQVTVVLLYVVY